MLTSFEGKQTPEGGELGVTLIVCDPGVTLIFCDPKYSGAEAAALWVGGQLWKLSGSLSQIK